MKRNRILCVLLVCLLIFSLTDCSCKKNKIPEYEDFDDSYTDSLPENAEDGLTLHAFNWTYHEIMVNLENIHNAGFKNVLTMPVQQPKSGGLFARMFR